jgi:hypothetical protein
LAERCPLLEDLNDGRMKFTPAGLLELWSRLRHLRKVILRDEQSSDETFLTLIRNNPHRESLDIAGEGITANFLTELSRCCTSLMELNLTYTTVVRESLDGVWQSCRNLQILRFSQCIILTFAPIVACPKMRVLELSGCSASDSSFHWLLEAFPGLTTIDIFECDDGPELRDLPLGELCPRLRSIKMLENDSGLGEVALRSIGAHCVDLHTFIVSGENVTDAGLCAMAEGCRKLVELDFAYCDTVTNKTLLAVAEHCVELKTLGVQSCKKITDKGVKAVIKGCPQLKHFGVHGCTRVSKTLQRIVKERYAVDDDDYLLDCD